MAIVSSVYAPFLRDTLDNVSRSIATLVTGQLTRTTHTGNHDTDDFRDDVSADAQGTNTAVGGTGVATVSIDTAGDEVEVDVPDTTWSAVSDGTDSGGFILYSNVGTPATDWLICSNKFVADVTPNGSDITVTMNIEGVFKISYTQ